MQSALTQSLSSAFINADEEARKLGQEFVGTEHLLLGMLARPETHAFHAMKAQVSIADLHGKIINSLPNSSKPTGVTGRLPFSPKAQGIINAAMSESQAAGEKKLSTRFVLLAMLNDSQSAVVAAISASGADLDELSRSLRNPTSHTEL